MKRQPYSVSVDPYIMMQILEKADEIAMQKQTNRSAVLTDIWCDALGIAEKPSNTRNFTRSMSKKIEA